MGAVLALLMLLALALPAAAQERVKRIGVILQGGPYYGYLDGLRDGLGKSGLEEGRHFALVIRDTDGNLSAAETAAQALERDGVDLIVALAASVTRAVKRSTSTVPIVFAVGSDPVAHGLVERLATPGGRLTGIHNIVTDLTAKRLELLQELVPRLRRIVVFYDPTNASATQSVALARGAGARLGIALAERPVASVENLQAGLLALGRGDADALFLISDAMIISRAGMIIERANALGIATMATYTDLVAGGALMAYGANYRAQGRRLATYVARVLAGTSPGDLPVEGMDVPSLAVNVKTAKALGLQVSDMMIARADEVID